MDATTKRSLYLVGAETLEGLAKARAVHNRVVEAGHEGDAADWRTWYTGDSEARDDPDEDLATLRREVEAMTRRLDEPSLSESDRWTTKKNLAKKLTGVVFQE